MSYDLQLATRRKPTQQDLEDWVRHNRRFRLLGSPRPVAGAVVVQARSFIRWQDIVLADGPVHPQSSDLADPLAASVTRPAWLMELHLAGRDFEPSVEAAQSLAVHLATRCEGAV